MPTITAGARRLMQNYGLDPARIDRAHLRRLDFDGDGRLDEKEARAFLGMADIDGSRKLSADETASFFRMLDGVGRRAAAGARGAAPAAPREGLRVPVREFVGKGFGGNRADWRRLGQRLNHATDRDLQSLIAEQSRDGSVRWSPSAEVFFRTLPHASPEARGRFATQALAAFRAGGTARHAQALGAAMATDREVFRAMLPQLSARELSMVTASAGRFAWWTGKGAGGNDVLVAPPRGEHAAVEGWWFDDDIVQAMLRNARTPAERRRVQQAVRDNVASYRRGEEPFPYFVPRQGMAILAKNGRRWRASRYGAPIHFLRAVAESRMYPAVLRRKAIDRLTPLTR